MVKVGLIKWGVASVSSYMVPEVVLEKLEPMLCVQFDFVGKSCDMHGPEQCCLPLYSLRYSMRMGQCVAELESILDQGTKPHFSVLIHLMVVHTTLLCTLWLYIQS